MLECIKLILIIDLISVAIYFVFRVVFKIDLFEQLNKKEEEPISEEEQKRIDKLNEEFNWWLLLSNIFWD